MASISGDFATSLVSHYRLEETSGNRVDELGTNLLTETGGTINSATGVQGSGADFESADSRYLYNASPSSLTDVNTYSVSFWYKPESTGTQGIVGVTTDNDNSIKFQFFLISSKIYFRRNKSGGTLIDVIGATTLTAGNLYHIVGTFSTTNGMVLYVNGASDGTSTDLTATVSATRTLSVGARRRAATHDIFTDGIVDEISIWDGRELTSSEVSTIYNGGAGIPYSAGGANPGSIFSFF